MTREMLMPGGASPAARRFMLQVIAAASEFAAKPRAVPMDLDNPGTPRQVGSTSHQARSGTSGLVVRQTSACSWLCCRSLWGLFVA